jgi:hypothetical protein
MAGQGTEYSGKREEGIDDKKKKRRRLDLSPGFRHTYKNGKTFEGEPFGFIP